ncbi:hypothetical protein [Nocardioides sp.]|uniref:hypothetical protein n=1 Tax=Nocardioides sp. TaxID=35761 RepID=UPI002736FD59|nr:hypothetical protein [Nocardioides sp.]MDP3893057.1 hypothetical protein [Nocardioides sp.]
MGRCAPHRLTRTPPTAALLAGLALLAGCGSPVAEYPTPTDFDRAARVWTDPWLAPDQTRVAGTVYGSTEGVDRRVGTRDTADGHGDPRRVLHREVVAAIAAGWDLLGADCRAEPARAVLGRGSGVADAAAATVEVSRDDAATRVRVTGVVPHHLDGSWPALDDPVSLQDSCLVDGTDGAPPPEVPELGPVLAGDAAVDTDPAGPAEWRRTTLDDAEAALLAAVNDDPWLVSTGSPLPDPDTLREGDVRRNGPTTAGELTPGPTTPAAAIAAVVATMEGWELTWATCGERRPTEATLRLRTLAGTAVARLRATGGAVAWQVRLPVPETPVPDRVNDVPVLGSSDCLTVGAPDDAVLNEGRPVAVVGESQPVVGR